MLYFYKFMVNEINDKSILFIDKKCVNLKQIKPLTFIYKIKHAYEF